MSSLLTVLSTIVTIASASLDCQASTLSQPNPIAAQYPTLTTGTVNGTVAVLPISYKLARQIIPSQYGILKDSYRQLLPSFPQDMYPALLQIELDHDVGQGTVIKIPDFQRASISYPFVDRLGDGYTAMLYTPYVLLSDSIIAIAGSDGYGEIAVPATFDPPCNAYAAAGTSGTTYLNAYAVANPSQGVAIGTRFAAVSSDSSPYSLDLNVTNQPQFGANSLLCDNFIRLFNTSITRSPYTPTAVRGNVTAIKPFFATSTTFENVYGFNLDNAFIENNFMTCESLQGYSGTGSGD
ncbi:hypothetical protein AMS68_002556 [Peltaster fructicola]|uniref:Peptidase A1 domain-containing protein n=1 Tax=Peltaster fructicola TaxID=286661 RepID=A0A6H0XQY9_9PEZI|nr:hypothetical protein AMS68_002556 [Peltaster fructicola]